MGKRLKPEEIIAKLREVEVRLARGETAAQAARASAAKWAGAERGGGGKAVVVAGWVCVVLADVVVGGGNWGVRCVSVCVWLGDGVCVWGSG